MANSQYLIKTLGIPYIVERNGVELPDPQQGFLNMEQNSGLPFIGFMPETEIQVDDWIVYPNGEKWYVYDTQTQYHYKDAIQLKCYIRSKAQYNESKAPATATFNIGTAYNSVIGNQSVVNMSVNDALQEAKQLIKETESPDKDELNQIIQLLEMIVDNKVTPHQGLFSRFSQVMERNSWITGSIMSAVFSWLMLQKG